MSSSFGAPSTKPSGGFELWAWVFMRLSGLALLFLALGHLIIMHLINNVDRIDYNFVAGRYAGGFWRAYDGALLLLAMLHGLNGSKILIDDYIHQPGKRRAALAFLYIIGGTFLVMGFYVVIFFKPVVAGAAP